MENEFISGSYERRLDRKINNLKIITSVGTVLILLVMIYLIVVTILLIQFYKTQQVDKLFDAVGDLQLIKEDLKSILNFIESVNG